MWASVAAPPVDWWPGLTSHNQIAERSKAEDSEQEKETPIPAPLF
uniref:Uncharacterized protein n=1 Tax=Arundo donax TaxID=35708 RepID=A0A0A9EAE2_ARUDO